MLGPASVIVPQTENSDGEILKWPPPIAYSSPSDDLTGPVSVFHKKSDREIISVRSLLNVRLQHIPQIRGEI